MTAIKPTVTDEMIEKGATVARAWGVRSSHGGWSDEETQRTCARDILEAVAPLIAARALRDAASEYAPGLVDRGYMKRYLTSRANEIEAGESDA